MAATESLLGFFNLAWCAEGLCIEHNTVYCLVLFALSGFLLFSFESPGNLKSESFCSLCKYTVNTRTTLSVLMRWRKMCSETDRSLSKSECFRTCLRILENGYIRSYASALEEAVIAISKHAN